MTLTILILLFLAATLMYMRGLVVMLRDHFGEDIVPTGLVFSLFFMWSAMVLVTHLGFVPAMRARERCRPAVLSGGKEGVDSLDGPHMIDASAAVEAAATVDQPTTPSALSPSRNVQISMRSPPGGSSSALSDRT